MTSIFKQQKMLTIRVVIQTVRQTSKMCLSKERPFAVKRSSRREQEFVFGLFLFIFFSEINHVLQAAFLNRTPKENPANEAAAGGEGPPHTPALGATPSPDPQRGSPERPFKVPRIFLPVPCLSSYN